MKRLLTLLALALSVPLSAASPAAAFTFLPGSEGFEVAAKRTDGLPQARAGAHPATLELTIATTGGQLRNFDLSLPPGLLVNPTILNECADAFHTPRISPYESSLSGESCINASQLGVLAIESGGETRYFGLFNLVPPFGSVAAIGASPYGTPLVFTFHLREGDSGLDVRLEDVPKGLDPRKLKLTIWGSPWEGSAPQGPGEPVPLDGHNPERGNCLNEQTGGSWGGCMSLGGNAAPLPFIKSFQTLPTTPCGQPLTYTTTVTSWSGEAAAATATTPALTNCNKPLSTPKAQLMTNAAAARTGLVFNLDVNDGGGIVNPDGIARPPIKTAIASLPEGLTINPSLGAGLGTCGEAEWGRETATSQEGEGCPNTSKIGAVKLEGALGLSEALHGSVYLATPYANPFGTLVAVYMIARLPRRGLVVKSEGKLEPDPHSGRLVATFDDLPRLLYTHFELSLREGQRSTLVSPPTCDTYTAGLDTASWAAPETFTHGASILLIDRGDGGGPCPPASLPFAPGLLAGSLSATAGAYTPLDLRMTRTDTDQEITSYSATFPPGLLGKIAGVATCPDEAIATAAHHSGIEEQAHPSCPAASSIGHTIAGYGVGGTLAWAPGGLYLAGPYHGAPLSVVAIDAAAIGPFDLGTVVVRQAVRIDPRTVQVSLDAAGSDPIPHILDGIPLHLRDIRVYVDRPDFMVNPTSCDPMQISSRLGGAGVDPFETGDDSSAESSQRYQVLSCSGLGFRPKLTLRLTGSVRHGGNPSLHALYKPGRGANISAVAVTLPRSTFLAQEHINEVCTRVQFRADNCPAGSIYGRARAVTPLMDEPLEGPVIVRSSKNSVPDLVADLHGRGIQVEVPGRIDSSRGGIRASFESLPDAPVTSFALTLFGGKRGLIANAGNPCKANRANARFIAQSNETEILHPLMKAKCKGGKRR